MSLELMEAFSDPIFESAEVKASDVQELIATLPAVGRAVLDLYGAYRRHLPASELTSEGDDAAEASPVSIPSEEVTEFIQRRLNYFPEMEEAAERLWAENGLAVHTLQQGLTSLLRQRYAVEVEIRAADLMAGPARAATTSSPAVSKSRRCCRRRAACSRSPTRSPISAITTASRRSSPRASFASEEANGLLRTALANYFAAAVLMPYRLFRDAATSTRYDVDILKNRFGVSFEQVCHRLTTLRRPGAEGVPFHFIRVDIAGNISKRFSASGIHIARFGAACPRWNVYDAFGTPGMLRVQLSRMPDGKTFFCIARTTGRTNAYADQRPAAPRRPARGRSRLRCPPCRRARLCRRPQSRRPAARHADRRFVPDLPAYRLRRARHAVALPEAPHRRERPRPVDLRADVSSRDSTLRDAARQASTPLLRASAAAGRRSPDNPVRPSSSRRCSCPRAARTAAARRAGR